MAGDAAAWDAQAELDVGLFILRYLHWNPPPEGAEFDRDLRAWAEEVRLDGLSRLGALGKKHLRAVL